MSGDEADENRTGAPDEFLSLPKYQRFLVFVAGPVFNLVLAFLFFWMFFGIYGKQEVPERYPNVIVTGEDSSARTSGFLPGDVVMQIDGLDIKRSDDFMKVYNDKVRLAPNQQVPVLIERDGLQQTLELNTGEDPVMKHGSPGWALSWSDVPTIGTLIGGDPADEAGLLSGDRILAAGGIEPINEVELRNLLQASPEVELPLLVEREGEVISLTVTPKDQGGSGWIGVGFVPAETVTRKLSIGAAAVESVNANIYLSKTLFVVLKRLVTGGLSLRTMSGPIGIAQVSRQALESGADSFLNLLAFFSLQLGILNLLPIPVLDGGHILILLVEGVMRRDLSEGIKDRVMQAGFVFLVAFMGVIIYLDIVKSL